MKGSLIVCFKKWFLLICFFAFKGYAFTQQTITPLKKAVVTVETHINRAAYERLGKRVSGGFVFDKDKGWVVTTHDVIGYGGVVATHEITFAGGQKLEARLLYADPSKNFAVLVFDPKELLTPVEEINTFAEDVHLGDAVLLVGKKEEQDIVQEGLVSGLYENVSVFPQEAIRVSLNSAGVSIGAPLLNEKNQLVGLILEGEHTFASALRSLFIRDALKTLKQGKTPVHRIIEGGVAYSESLADAVRYLNFPESELRKFMEKYPDALAQGLIFRTLTDTPSPIQVGDILWTVNGQFVGPSLYQVDSILDASPSDKAVLEVWRRGKLLRIEVPVATLDPSPIREMVVFAGATFFQSDRRLRHLFNIPRGSLMIVHTMPGSPFSTVFQPLAAPHEMRSFNVIDGIMGHAVHTLQDVIQQIPAMLERRYCPLTVRIFGFYVVMGNYISMSRTPKLALVNLEAASKIPEKLSLNPKTQEWHLEPIVLPKLSCEKPAS